MAGKITRTEVIDCTCTPHREHGDPHCYNVHKCGCNDCREGYLKYRKVMAYNKQQGKGQILDASKTRDYITNLHKRGMTFRGIAEAAGMHHFAIYRIYTGKVKGVSRTNAAKIRAVPLPSHDGVGVRMGKR